MIEQQTALGLAKGNTRIAPYDPNWSRLFESLAAEMMLVLGNRILTIEHVGSTAVVGLAAKPILDVLIGVPDFEQARTLVTDLARFGFWFRPDEDIPDRHFFNRSVGELRTHHLSLAEPASSHYRDTVAFRDALRADQELTQQYQDLKLKLAKQFPSDRESYLNGKTAFVRSVLDASGIPRNNTR